MIVRRDLTDGFNVVIRNTDETGDQRLKPGLCLARAGRRKRGERAAMPGLLHDNDLRIVDAALMTVQTCNLDGTFVGLGTGIAEERVIHARQFAQLLRQRGLLRHLNQIGGVDDFAGLLGDGFDEPGVRMTESGYGDTGERVEITLAVGIPEPGALTARKGDR